ncbi:transglutaminase-like domain-containing protein [Anianabacter salinae]|uniref:transglutaminase-like domain-containing protein n=1 Tax=Anianabacter salinae TaxID=2851023 RepID=UPI00225E24ED|nr:transglutaminase family protein [Anianabacter salinae]MBV0913823.1 transglutaminase family protein [Anianabacter salinae]
MNLNIDVSMTYRLGAKRLALLAFEAAQYDGQSVFEDRIEIEDAVLHDLEGEGGVGRRKWVRIRGEHLILRYQAHARVSRAPARLDCLDAVPLDDLPGEAFSYLRPSRYCQSDQLEIFADRRFGHLSGGSKILAILDWIAAELEYVPGHSDGATSLLDTFATRKGVCRDYAHMMCGLARASQIPARYVSAYGASVTPPDFHAVVEVWLDGAWHIVDPTGMCSADEIAVIGVGRDAADVPFMETPDEAQFVEQIVRVEARAGGGR